MPEFVAGLCVLSLLWAGFALYAGRARRRRLSDRMKAQWRILEEGREGAVSVYVIRRVGGDVVDRILVVRVPDGDPDRNAKIQTAHAEADELIATLGRPQ